LASRVQLAGYPISSRLVAALANLSSAMAEIDSLLAEMRAHQGPLALHIFVPRRDYRNVRGTKSGKRHDTTARMSWRRACELGFRGSAADWQRLLEAGSAG
jgi:hypothetical protein